MSSPAPARNRVTPLGEIVAVPGRGAWMGNRGVLHEGHHVVRHHRNRAWITCALAFKGRSLPQWRPGRYTQLFFLDEAVALAAGHRPCAECRRAAYNAYRASWEGSPRAPQLDAVLHRQRWDPTCRDRLLHAHAWADLPDGAFVLHERGLALVLEDHLALWEPANRYGAHLVRPRVGSATLITPPASVEALRAGYPVQIDEAAR